MTRSCPCRHLQQCLVKCSFQLANKRCQVLHGFHAFTIPCLVSITTGWPQSWRWRGPHAPAAHVSGRLNSSSSSSSSGQQLMTAMQMKMRSGAVVARQQDTSLQQWHHRTGSAAPACNCHLEQDSRCKLAAAQMCWTSVLLPAVQLQVMVMSHLTCSKL